MRTPLAAVVLSTLAAFAPPAHADLANAPEAAPPVVLDAARVATGAIDPNAVREAVARELGVPVVVASSTAPAVAPRGHLTIALDAARRIVVVYRDAAGNEVIRATAMPHD